MATTLGAAPLQTPSKYQRPTANASRLPDGQAADISVMTYNVKDLPWPIAQGRPEAIREIGDRLALMRALGQQPTLVVLQEAFGADAKAIGDRAGYAYQVFGPFLRAGAGVRAEAGGSWYLGENRPSALDSGLVILSDLPVTEVVRAAFPTDSCAGYDCLAAKGIVMATVDVPGRGPVAIANTHLNSRTASGAPFARASAAYRRQTDFLAQFIRSHRRADTPMIVAGDFNRAQHRDRVAALNAAVGGAREGLAESIRQALVTTSATDDARAIHLSARDMQFLFDARATALEVRGADVPFGTEHGREPLSDHMGFTIRYRLARAATTP